MSRRRSASHEVASSPLRPVNSCNARLVLPSLKAEWGQSTFNSNIRRKRALTTFIREHINMIHINPSDFFSSGLHRECYIHPENEDLCIKVIVAGDSSESQREQKYYSHLQKRNITWEVLPKFYGLVETNLGPGAVFDLIRNHDGSISKTLAHYLASSEKSESHYPGLSQAMSLLKNNLYQQRILTMTLKPKNILYKKTSPEEGRLIIVDNIGNSDFIPICNYSTILARYKISRKWQRFVRSVLNTYPDNKALHRMLNSP